MLTYDFNNDIIRKSSGQQTTFDKKTKKVSKNVDKRLG